ncbi:hypothetical protein BDR26DRAFT_917749 [Obelidium mucronatum]|nr:hypothetical protein BDR26DRAFT_917749 [Obelidium mucronatum]
MAGTYTLKLQLPQLPPSILLGPIDITYFFLCVATFPDERIGNGGHEVIGPIDFEVLPDVQRISIEPGFDEAVEFLEGMGGMNGPMVRPRVLQLVPWSPPDLISPLQEPQRLGSLGGENMPGMFPSTPVRTGSEPPPPLGFPQPPFQQMAMPPPTMMMGQQFYQQQQQMPNWQGTMTPGMFPGPPPPSAVHLAAEVSMQQQLQADEQSRQIVEAQEELGRIQQETARARELLAQKQREETEKARLEAYQEAERKLQEEREQLEVLRHQLSQMKSSAMLKTATTATITAAPSLAAPTEPTVTNRLSQGNFSSQYQQPPQPSYIPVHHQNSYAPPPGTAWLDDAYGSPSRDPRLTPINTGQQTAITPIPTHSPIEDNPHNPALETHSYPKPASLSINNAPPPRQTPSYSDYSNTPTQPSRSNSGLNRPGDIPPSPSTTPQPLMSAAATPTPSTASQPKPKKKWWFSKSPSQSTSANTSSASLSSPRPSNAAQAAPQLNNTELLINQICDDATSNYRRSIKRNYKALMGARDRDANKRKYLNEASGAVKGILERDGDVRGVLDALQAEFLVIDQETIQSFENDKRDSLLRQIRSLKSGLLTAIQAQAITDINDLQEQFASVLKPLREDLKESVFYPGMGDTEKRVLEELANRVWSDCIKTFERDVKGPCVAELDKLNKKSGRGGSVGNSGSSGGGTWGRASASSSSSSLSSGRQPPQPQKDTTISVCLRPDCGKKKVGYGQSKLFCSIQCEKQMNQEQMRAMSNYS